MNFVDFARANGVNIHQLFPSDRIQRCGTNVKPLSRNGAYFWDGRRGWCMDWSGEARVIWWDGDGVSPWTDQEKRLWAQKRAAAASEQQRRYQEAATRAEADLKKAVRSTHGYLKMKGFDDEEGLVLDEKLLVPMRNVVTNRLQGYQAIKWLPDERRYEKKMLAGMRARNAVYWLGKGSDEVWLVEGYATGLSVRAALKSCGIPASVCVTFSASNLVQVSDQIGGSRFVFADHDESGTGQDAAEQTGLLWTMSDEIGDANDLHYRDGLFGVVNKIMQCRLRA